MPRCLFSNLNENHKCKLMAHGLRNLRGYTKQGWRMPFFLLFPDFRIFSSVQRENEMEFSHLNNYVYIWEYSCTSPKHFKCKDKYFFMNKSKSGNVLPTFPDFSALLNGISDQNIM